MTTTPPDIIASRYRILRELGRGGMGVVYLVEHINTGDHLALKVLLGHAGAKADVVERFKREARAPARIKSEHVVKVTDADVAPELGGAPFLVMEALDGSDLEKQLAARGPVSPSELLTILAQVASALDKAHAIGIVHRDLKPENLFLHRRENGQPIVKILDFGISKMLGEGASAMEQAGITKTGAVMGTPLYMSPEQARGDIARIGPPTDIWAIGLIAYKLLSGQTYWWAETMTALLLQIVNEPLVPPSSRARRIPPAFDAWFFRSCEREPQARWQTVGEQVGALAIALGLSLDPASARPSEVGAIAMGPVALAGPPISSAPAHTPPIGLSAAGVSRTQSPAVSNGKQGLIIASISIAMLVVASVALVTLFARLHPPPNSVASAGVTAASRPTASSPVADDSGVASPPPPVSAAPIPPVSSVQQAPSASRKSPPRATPAKPAGAKTFDPAAP